MLLFEVMNQTISFRGATVKSNVLNLVVMEIVIIIYDRELSSSSMSQP